MSQARTGLLVMIVEDEPMVSDFIAMVLDDSPHRVVGVAETGPDALDLAEQAAPDLVLLDIKLRGPFDGVQLAARLRARWPALRIVFASGSHDPATRARADAVRPDGFLRKPFVAAHVLAVLDRLGELDRVG